MAPLVVDPCGYLKPHHSVGHCPDPGLPQSASSSRKLDWTPAQNCLYRASRSLSWRSFVTRTLLDQSSGCTSTRSPRSGD